MLRDSTVARRRAYALTSNTAAHDNHEKISSWVSFSLYGYGAPLGGPSGRRSSAIIPFVLFPTFLPIFLVVLFSLFPVFLFVSFFLFPIFLVVLFSLFLVFLFVSFFLFHISDVSLLFPLLAAFVSLPIHFPKFYYGAFCCL